MKTYEINDQQIMAIWNQVKKFPGEDVVPVHSLLLSLKPINKESTDVKHIVNKTQKTESVSSVDVKSEGNA